MPLTALTLRIGSSSDEGRGSSFFAGSVSSSRERDLVIEDDVSTVSIFLNLPVFPGLKVAATEEEECIRELLDGVSGQEGARSGQKCRCEGDDGGSFVDIMSGFTAGGGAESEGWTIADALDRANFSLETLAEGVIDTSQLPTF